MENTCPCTGATVKFSLKTFLIAAGK